MSNYDWRSTDVEEEEEGQIIFNAYQHIKADLLTGENPQSMKRATLTLCSPLTSQLHPTTASTTRQTPHAAIGNIVLLMMGIMMPETC